jgi:glycosyltransferase involved in cell wall biosynthesis
VLFVEEEPFSFAAGQAARIARARRIPLVVHENQNIARRLPPPFERIRRRVLATAAGVTVRNEAATKLVRDLGFTRPVGEFPHAVDISGYDGVSDAAGLPRPVVGFVGRLVKEKGILDLITALSGTGASLLVVGDGPLAEEARSLAELLGVRARWLGAVPHDDVPAWYGAMDLVAIPSRTTRTWMEQFGRIVIEAGAAGVAVITTDSGELPATIEATGGGVSVPEGDVTALHTAIAELLADEPRRKALGQAGRRGVEQRFTHAAVAGALARFLAEVAG